MDWQSTAMAMLLGAALLSTVSALQGTDSRQHLLGKHVAEDIADATMPGVRNRHQPPLLRLAIDDKGSLTRGGSHEAPRPRKGRAGNSEPGFSHERVAAVRPPLAGMYEHRPTENKTSFLEGTNDLEEDDSGTALTKEKCEACKDENFNCTKKNVVRGGKFTECANSSTAPGMGFHPVLHVHGEDKDKFIVNIYSQDDTEQKWYDSEKQTCLKNTDLYLQVPEDKIICADIKCESAALDECFISYSIVWEEVDVNAMKRANKKKMIIIISVFVLCCLCPCIVVIVMKRKGKGEADGEFQQGYGEGGGKGQPQTAYDQTWGQPPGGQTW